MAGSSDMVFDKNGNPAFNGAPETVKRMLRHRLANDRHFRSTGVRVGKTMKIVSVREYLGES